MHLLAHLGALRTADRDGWRVMLGVTIMTFLVLIARLLPRKTR